MKKGSSMLAALAAGLVMLLSIRPAFAASSPRINAPKSFQAQFTLQVGGNPPQHGVMYYSHGRIREEMASADGGPKAITIIDPLNKTIYQIEEQKKAFKIEPWDPRSALLSEALKRSGKHRLVQTQTIAGQECDNFKIEPWDPRSALLSEALKRSGKHRLVQTQTIAGQECDNFKIEPWDPRSALLSEALKRSGKHRLVQTQTIAGQECDNFEIEPSEPEVKPYFVFVNKTTRFPVELTTQDPDPSKQIHIEWTNLSPGYQAAILFAPPLGYAELK